VSFGPKPWQQLHWDARAAANFMLGGTGAGLLVAWAVSAAVTPAWQAFVVVGLACIGLGLGAVWLEIGRKLRAVNVFFHPQTSWMTREAMVAVVLFGIGLAAIVSGAQALGIAAALVAIGFVYCQGRILHAAKGIPAWREPAVTAFIVTTGLAEGAGAFLAGAALAGGSHRAGLAFFALAVVARAIAWSRYRARLAHGASRRALDIDVDPLIVASRARELVDAPLADRVPVALAERFADEGLDRRDIRNDRAGRHAQDYDPISEVAILAAGSRRTN